MYSQRVPGVSGKKGLVTAAAQAVGMSGVYRGSVGEELSQPASETQTNPATTACSERDLVPVRQFMESSIDSDVILDLDGGARETLLL